MPFRFIMFRSKRDVDRHVQEILNKVKNEAERNLRFYNVAKLYYNVGDFDSAQQYIRCYLSIRPEVAGAHKLLAQALEGLKQKEKALEEYKCSLKLESRQPDVVLKVCDLIVELQLKLDAGEARYWKERAEEERGTHPSVFKFKEYLIKMEGGSGDHSELEQLIKQEVEARPLDAAPRIRLLRLYLDNKRSAEALKYAVDLESSFPFFSNLQWYSCLTDVFKAFYSDKSSSLDCQFYLNYLSVLNRHVLLAQREQRGHRCAGHTDPLFEFDQFLYHADHFCRNSEQPLLQECIRHMSGQLCFHLAVALLSAGKQSRVGWKEYTPSAFALLSFAWGAHVSDPSSWISRNRDQELKLLKVWQRDAAFRCSQAGHVLSSSPQYQKCLSQLCKQNWRQKVWDKIFTSSQSPATSYFVHHELFADISFSSPSTNRLSAFDKMSQQHQPDSLHCFVWLGLQNIQKFPKKSHGHGHNYVPTYSISQDFACQVFEKLKLTTNDIKSCGVETLCRLDVDSFLYASVFCAAAAHDDLHNRGLVSEDRPAVLPVDLTDPLCTVQQSKWWSSVYRLYTNTAGKELGEIRLTVQRGLEVIRLIGNHGMDVRLVVQLAKHFAQKASASTDTRAKASAQAFSDWAFMYWNHALTLLEKMDKNQAIHLPENRIFSYISPELTANEIKSFNEEGRFFIACRFLRDEQYEKAIDIFQCLKSPYASFYQGIIYKKLADAEIEPVNEEITGDMKSNHIILLRESRAAFYLTLDRLRAPHVDSNHPLNAELNPYLQEVEDRLSHLETEVSVISNRGVCSALPNDSCLVSQHVRDRSASCIANASSHQSMLSMMGITNGHAVGQGWTSTPVKKTFDPDASLTSDNLQRMEARPSPERLDAQLRRMTINNETFIQTLTEQNRKMLESNKSIVEALEKSRLAVEDLKNQVADLRLEVGRLKASGSRSHPERNEKFVNEGDFNEDLDLAASQLGSLSSYPYGHQSFDIRSATLVPPRPLSATQMLPQAFFPQSQVPMYQPPLAAYYGLNYNDGQTSGISNTLSSALPTISGALPSAIPAAVPGVPPGITGGVSVSPVIGTHVNGSPLAYGKAPLIGAPTTITTIGSATIASSSSQVSRQALPVNVVITSSDVVPTQAPTQQPQLSVTIPPQHRHASILAAQGRSLPISATMVSSSETKLVPHNFQISMPLQANIPTSESLEKSLSPLKPVSTQALLTDVPSPIHSAIAVSSSKKPDHKESHLSTDSVSGDDTVSEDIDYNPCPDFKPVIPLPEEIVVTTGEENEVCLFECRAKLYRFVDREWKERGVGPIKILKNKDTGKPRILMRRDQVHKICANHLICPETELAPQIGCERAWTWAAQDYADQQMQVEKLCVRFKTVEDAANFKEAFNKARELSKLSVSPEKEEVQPKTPSKLIAESKLKVSPKADSPGKVELGGFSFTSTPVFEPLKNESKTPREDKIASPQKPSPFAGFSFSTAGKDNVSSSNQKPSPFAGLSSSSISIVSAKPAQSSASQGALLTSSPNGGTKTVPSSSVHPSFPQVNKSLIESQKSSVTMPDSKETNTSGGFVFGGSSSAIDFATLASQNKGKEVGRQDPNFRGFEGAGTMVFGGKTSQSKENIACKDTIADKENFAVKIGEAQASTGNSVTPQKDEGVEADEDFEPTAVFSPVIPLPSLVETRTGEEDEEIVFEERAKLLRFDTESREWKDRGVGKMKVLQNKANGKVRLVMRREQVLKVCCNHYISKDMEFKPLTTSDKALTWSAKDFAEGEMRLEVFALRFKSPELMLKFKHVVEDLQKNLDSTSQVDTTQVLPAAQKTETKSLAELFKPKEGSWECSGCMTRNDASKTSCPCCQTPKPGCEMKSSEAKAAPSSFSFGIKPNEKSDGDSGSPVTGFKFSNLTTSSSKQPSLAEMFKPKVGSWECQSCYTRNDADKTSCVACCMSKSGTNDSKVTSSAFSFGVDSKPSTNFTFGVSSSNDKQPSEIKPFCFGTSSPAVKSDKIPTFVFGAGSEVSSQGMSKGFNFNPSPDSTVPKQGFVFGTASTTAPDSSFGSPHKFDFKIKEKSPLKSPGCPSGADDSDEAAEEDSGDDIHFQPIIPLPDKVPVYTGEEDETLLYSQRAKLYRLVDKEWKERGLGDIKVLRHNTSQKVRLLMRREQVLKLCLNHFISADFVLMKKDEKTWMWGAQDYSEGEVTTERFACRFKSADIAADFKKAVDDAKAGLTASPSPKAQDEPNKFVAALPPEGVPVSSAMKNFTFKLPDTRGVARNLFGMSSEVPTNSDDIQVVYEAEVTSEERAAALKLKLPQNFYLYKNAPPCSGCSGCEEDSDSDQGVGKINNAPSLSASLTAVSSVESGSLFVQSSFSVASPSLSMFGGSGTQSLSSGSPLSLGKSLVETTSPNAPESEMTNAGSTAVRPSTFVSNDSKSGDKGSIPFLPVNESLSFSSLAAASPSNIAFKSDPSKPFAFAGAGSMVFGRLPDPPCSSTKGGDEHGGDSSGGEDVGGENETHDPHFEPIISLPDMVEVRTGEEEEEKLFCQRAKLFRYDTNTKEWKERGVGEMKILKHPGNGTFRLLLRREQVHKVVLNQRVDGSIELKPLSSSDKSWCWGGMNYAEEGGALEELAVRFKTSEQAQEFAAMLASCQKALIEARSSHAAVGSFSEDPYCEEEEEESEDEDGAYSDADEEILFEERVTLSSRMESSGNNILLGFGDLRVTRCSNGDGVDSFWVEVVDDTEKLLCRMPILGDSEVKREGNSCTWKGGDLSEDEHGIEKTVIAEFDSEKTAEDFQDMFYRLGIEVVEQTYTHVEEIED